jgi:hypothetical protein
MANNKFSYGRTYHRKMKSKVLVDDYENTSLNSQIEREIERDQGS